MTPTRAPDGKAAGILDYRLLEPGIRIALLALLVFWCVRIVSPFIGVVAWALIIAITVYPAYCWTLLRLGGRARLVSVLFGCAGLLAIIVPATLFADTVIDGSRLVAGYLEGGRLHLPAPPARVASIPVVGGLVDSNWRLASENLPALVQQFQPQLQSFGRWLLGVTAQAGLGLLQFMLAILMAAVFLLYAVIGQAYAQRLASKLSGLQGAGYLQLVVNTIRSVAKGVLGVALIQALLAGLGMLVAGIPGAGLLTVLCLLLCVAQIGSGPILIPCVIWLFYSGNPLMASAFLAWSVLVMTLDNVLKPLLLGRGVNVPMLVVFVGAIGGFLSNGFIGLFVGAVVLVLGYTVLQSWLSQLPGDSA